MEINQVVVVFGHGLMNVIEVDAKKSAFSCVSHGPKKTDNGHWFPFDRARELTPTETKEALTRERKEAAARKVSCNNPDCWCIAWFR